MFEARFYNHFKLFEMVTPCQALQIEATFHYSIIHLNLVLALMFGFVIKVLAAVSPRLNPWRRI